MTAKVKLKMYVSSSLYHAEVTVAGRSFLLRIPRVTTEDKLSGKDNLGRISSMFVLPRPGVCLNVGLAVNSKTFKAIFFIVNYVFS